MKSPVTSASVVLQSPVRSGSATIQVGEIYLLSTCGKIMFRIVKGVAQLMIDNDKKPVGDYLPENQWYMVEGICWIKNATVETCDIEYIFI